HRIHPQFDMKRSDGSRYISVYVCNMFVYDIYLWTSSASLPEAADPRQSYLSLYQRTLYKAKLLLLQTASKYVCLLRSSASPTLSPLVCISILMLSFQLTLVSLFSSFWS
ncbi:hypothetical protein L9F63_011439, partial [Diploptera punctata]